MNAQHVRLCAALAALLVAAGMEPEAMAGIKPEAMAGIKPEAMAGIKPEARAAKWADIGAPTGTETADGKALTLEFIDKAITEGRLKSAGELILRARARYAGPELTLREAELMLAGGATTEAATAFQQLEGDPIVGARALAGRGIAAIRAGQDAAAETLLAAAVARDPSLARAWSARGVLADRRRDWAAADGFYTQALKAAPDSAAFLNNRGYSRLLQGRHADAEEDLVRAVKLDPALKAAQTNLTLAKAMQGRYAEAFASRDRDELARDLNTVGVAAMLRGDNRIAQSYFTRAIEMNGRFDKTAAANLAYLKAIDPALDSEAKVERR